MPKTTGQSMTEPNFALLIDGDNIRSSLYPDIRRATAEIGQMTSRRVYGNATSAAMENGWPNVTQLRFIHSGTGKNATDLLICVDAMDLVLRGVVDGIILVTADGDFSHLAHYLRERRTPLHCIGTAQISPRLSEVAASCTIVPLPIPKAEIPPAPILAAGISGKPPKVVDDKALCKTLRRLLQEKKGGTLPMLRLHQHMGEALPGVDLIRSKNGKTWRQWLSTQKDSFAIHGEGQNRYVRAAP
ncbi:NYN domain-containing protein [Sinirhodobacter populi]|nr:NYN domain-containing protein [Sinirhodobacter populi]